jgi:hypothetical protein
MQTMRKWADIDEMTDNEERTDNKRRTDNEERRENEARGDHMERGDNETEKFTTSHSPQNNSYLCRWWEITCSSWRSVRRRP